MTSLDQSREKQRNDFLELVAEVKDMITYSIKDNTVLDDQMEIALKYFAESLIVDFPPPLKLTDFFIQEVGGDLVWIEHKTGSGMMTGKANLNKAVKKFFNRNQ